MVGVRSALPQADACLLHRFRLRTPLLELGVELDHEFLGAVVVNVPKAQDERLRSGLQQAPDQTHQLIAGRDHVQAGRAAAQHDQFDRQLQVSHVVEAEMRGSETNRGEHRVILSKVSVGCNVYGLAFWPMILQHALGGLIVHE